jgi:hypothetical protein
MGALGLLLYWWYNGLTTKGELSMAQKIDEFDASQIGHCEGTEEAK